jgi:hypothetical protein
VLNLVWVPLIWYFYVETAGLSLEEVDLVFKIQYHGGKKMTFEEAKRLAKEESLTRRQSFGDKQARIQLAEVF